MNLHGKRFNQHTLSFSNDLPIQCLLHYSNNNNNITVNYHINCNYNEEEADLPPLNFKSLKPSILI